MKSYLKKPLVVAVAALGLLSAAGTAQATLFEIDFSNSGAFSGTAPSTPSNPNTVYANAIFNDGGGTGTVTLTMSVLPNLLPAGAFANDFYFNVDPNLAGALGITFSNLDVAASSIQNGTNCCKADGTGGDFDLAFHFPTANPGELAQGHTSTYILTGSNITANSFNFNSIADPANSLSGGFVGALHLQGYGNSVWVSGVGVGGGGGGAQIPEPATLALIGLGLFGIAATRRRRA